MKRFWAVAASALLLGQGPALAQEEAAPEEEVVEESPAEQAPAGAAPAGEEAAVEEVSEEEVAGEAPAEEEPAYEGEYSGFIDAYYVPTSAFGTPGADAYADGAGGRAQFQFWKFLAASVEYTTRTFDDDSKLDDQRFGLGAVARNGSGDTAGLFVELERYEFEDGSTIDGPAVHGRLSHPAYEWLRFYADLGYKRLEGDAEKFSGFEFNAGLLASFGPIGVFADWRRGQLEGKDSGGRLHLEDVRTGLRWTFGEGGD